MENTLAGTLRALPIPPTSSELTKTIRFAKPARTLAEHAPHRK